MFKVIRDAEEGRVNSGRVENAAVKAIDLAAGEQQSAFRPKGK